MTPTLALTGKQYRVPIENNSDCLLVAVTVVKVERLANGDLKEMNLHWAEWMYPGDTGEAFFEEGKEYAVMIEAFTFDRATRKATGIVGSQYREGIFDPKKIDMQKIDIRCGHTVLRKT